MADFQTNKVIGILDANHLADNADFFIGVQQEVFRLFYTCIFKMDSNVDTRALWEQLLKLQADDETYGLMRSHALIALYTQLYLSRSKELAGSYHIPSYIADIKICSFVGKRRCNGYFAAAEQIRKAFAEVVGAGISSFKIVGEGETVAGFLAI